MVKTADGFEGFVLSTAQIFVSQLIYRYSKLIGYFSSFATLYFSFGLPFYFVFTTAPMWYTLGVFCPLQLAPWMVFFFNKQTVSLLYMMLPCSVLSSVFLVGERLGRSKNGSFIGTAVFWFINAFLSLFSQVEQFNPESSLALYETWPVKSFADTWHFNDWKQINSLQAFMDCTIKPLYANQWMLWVAAVALLGLASCFGRNRQEKSGLEQALKKED